MYDHRMNSQAIEATLKLDDRSWRSWPNPGLAIAPSSHGVYVFRRTRGSVISRVQGSSEIVYVGSGNIRSRLRAHCNPDWDSFKNSGWLISLVANGAPLEVSWQVMQLKTARSLEIQILQEYLVDHRELPPANRQIRGISVENGIAIAILSLDDAARARVLKHLEDQMRSGKYGDRTE